MTMEQRTLNMTLEDGLGYIYLSKPPVWVSRTRSWAGLQLDYNAEGQIVGIEVLDTRVLPTDLLEGPEP